MDGSGRTELRALSAIERLGGEALVGKVIDLAIDNVSRQLGSAVRAAQRSDLAALRLAAHSVRSSAGAVGARRLAAAAEALEELAAKTAGRSGEVGAALRRLQLEWARVCPRLVVRRRLAEVRCGGSR